ncbi:hypothetical protein D3C80_1512120 [compost metagenome]
MVKGFIFAHLGAKSVLPRQTQRNTGDKWADKRRADTADNLGERGDTVTLTEPNQQSAHGDHHAKYGQQSAFIFRGVSDKSSRQCGQQSCDAACCH